MTYDSLMYGGTKVRRERRPSVYSPIPDVSSGKRFLGGEMQKFGSVLNTLVEDYIKQVDDNRVLARTAAINGRVRELRSDLLSRKGNEADGIVVEAEAFIDDLVERGVNEPGLTDRGKTNLRQIMFHFKQSTLQRLALHEGEQSAIAVVANQANIDRDALEQLEANPTLAQELLTLELMNGIDLKGMPEGEEPGPLRVQQLQENMAQARVTLIEANINAGRLDVASELLDREKDDKRISARVERQLRGLLKQASGRQETREAKEVANQIALEIYDAGGTLQEQLDKTDKITDPGQRDSVRADLRAWFVRDREQRKVAVRTERENWANIWRENPRVETIREDILTPAQVKGARAYANMIQSGKTPETDGLAVQELVGIINTKVEKFKNMHLLFEFGTRLSPDHLRFWEGLQREIRGGGGQTKRRSLISADSQIKDAMKDARIDTTADTPSERQVRTDIYDFVESEMATRGWTLDTVTREQMDEILSLAFRIGTLDTWLLPHWLEGDVRYYRVEQGRADAERFYFHDIPEGEREDIVRALKAAGNHDPSDQDITREWIAGVRSGVFEP